MQLTNILQLTLLRKDIVELRLNNKIIWSKGTPEPCYLLDKDDLYLLDADGNNLIARR